MQSFLTGTVLSRAAHTPRILRRALNFVLLLTLLGSVRSVHAQNLFCGTYSAGKGYIYTFNSAGTQIAKVTMPLSQNSAGSVSVPSRMAVGPDGNLYVVSSDLRHVIRFNGTTGALIGTFGPEITTGTFGLSALTFSQDGSLYVTWNSAHAITHLQGPSGTSPGALIGTVGPAESVVSLVFKPNCELLAFTTTDFTTFHCKRYSPTGTYIADLFAIGAYVDDMAIDANGYLDVMVNGGDTNQYLVKYDANTGANLGTLFTLSVPNGVPFTGLGQIGWGGDNKLYIGRELDYSNGTAEGQIWRYDPTTNKATAYKTALDELVSALALAGAPLGMAFPQNYATQLAFRETGASVWTPNTPATITKSWTIAPSWDTGGTQAAGGYYDVKTPAVYVDPCFGLFGGCGFTIPSIDFGDFGGKVSVNSHGTAGLKFTATVNTGSVNVNYPVQITMNFPDRNYLFAGDWFTVMTGYKIDPAANMGTQSPHANAQIDLLMNGYFYASANAKAFGGDIFNTTITPPAGSDLSGISGNFDYGRTLLSTDAILGTSPQINFDIGGQGIVTGYVKLPNIATAGMPKSTAPDPRVITTSGSDTFFSITGSLSNFARKVIQDTTGVYVPLGNDSVGKHFAGSGFDAGYSLMDIYTKLDMNVAQDFTFAPVPHVKLQLPAGVVVNWRNKSGTQFNGVNVFEFDAGDAIQIQMPSNPLLQFTATYTLPNTFSHVLSLVIDPSLNLNPLELTASGSFAGYSLGSFDFQPIPTQTVSLATLGVNAKFPLYSTSFTLPGFQTVTQNGVAVGGRLHPAPALGMLTPGTIPMVIVPYSNNNTRLPADVENGSTTLKISGMTFPTTGAQAYFTIHGSAPLTLATTYVDACDLNVTLPNKYLLIAGTGQIYVTIPNAAGNSNSLNVVITNPLPHIDLTGPNVYAADPNLGGNQLMTVTDNSSTFLWGANYYNTIQAKWFATYNSSMASFFPGYDFNTVTPLPAIHWKASDGIDKTLALYQEQNPSGLLWAVLPLSYYAKPDKAQITVVSPGPGGGVSNALNLTIGYAIPQVTALNPAIVLPGSGNFRLEVTGPLSQNVPPQQGAYGNFNATSTIYWDGAALPNATVFVTPGDIYTDVPASYVTAPGSHTIKVVSTVYNGQGGGSSTYNSNTLTLVVKSPVPVIAANAANPTALYPATVVSADRSFLGAPGAAQYNLTVNGQNFVNGSVVQWNGAALTTKYVNDTQIIAAVPYSNVATPGTFNVTILNPIAGGGGGTSNTAAFTIVNAKPNDTVLTALTATQLTPNSVAPGSAATGIAIQGEGFYSGSVAYFNGSPRVTTFNAHNALIVKLTAADLATPGTAQITVVNPAPVGGTSSPLTLTIGSLLAGTLTFDSLVSTAAAQNVTFTLRPSDNSGNIVRTLQVPANGAFFLSGLPRKNYVVHIKGDKFLAVNVNANATSGDVTNLAATLPGGDATNDNFVDVGDFGVLVNAYNSDKNIAGSGYDARADFTGDGVVDVADFGVLVNNYNAAGAN